MTELFAPVIYPRILTKGLMIFEIEALRPLVGSIDAVEALPDGRFHAEEYDAMVIVDGEYHTHSWDIHRRLVFAEEPKVTQGVTTSGRDFGGSSPLTRARTQPAPAKRLVIPDDFKDSGLARLVESSCMPEPGAPYRGIPHRVNPAREVVSLLEEDLKEPMVLAALLSIGSGPGQPADSAIWLPQTALRHLAEWMQVALRFWRVGAPELFPESADWHKAEQWASPQESAARAALAHFEREEEERLQRAQAEERELRATVDATVSDGEHWRQLLTATGDELVAAVAETFESLGFSVVDADELPEHKGKKREDLRVSDGAWVAVTEVKGMTGAARSNALMQVTNAAAQFATTQGRRPDALWYVVNAYRDDDPAQRPVVLSGRDEDVAMFGDMHHGLVIDTRELFALRQAVTLGTLSPEQARDQLQRTTGLFRIAPSE